MFSKGILSAKKAVILCPHTDDEYGCAGTIIRLLSSGAEIYYYAFSKCEESVPEGFPKDVLEKECLKCTEKLGIGSNNVNIWNYKVRNFPHERQNILEKLVVVNKEIQPDLVLLPASGDIHQDHQTVYREGFRAFKYSTILGYELPQNLRSFENTAFISLTKKEIELKVEALSCYKSQASRAYSDQYFIKSLAHVRGVQCNAEYAESFELVRLVV